MVVKVTSLYLALFYCIVGSAQNVDISHSALQNMVDYTSQFSNQQDARVQPQINSVDNSNLENDPFIRTLFKEFLVQYQQLAKEQSTEIPLTTTPEEPAKLSSAFQNPSQPPVDVKAHIAPEPSPSPHRRRVAPRRKANSLQTVRANINHVTPSTTPFSTLLSRANFPHHETLESSTSFPLLRQKYFGIDSSTSKKVLPKVLSMHIQTTPAPQVILEELPVQTQPPRPVPKLKLLQNVSNKSSKPSAVVETKPKMVVKPTFDEAEFRRQAESAKYEFASEIDDGINGNVHQREEVRNGLAVKGRYSYSDGYYKRTVHYEADDKGYRIVKEETEPLVGPQGNPDGHALISSYVDGNFVNYEITKDDIAKKNLKTRFHQLAPVEDELEDL